MPCSFSGSVSWGFDPQSEFYIVLISLCTLCRCSVGTPGLLGSRPPWRRAEATTSGPARGLPELSPGEGTRWRSPKEAEPRKCGRRSRFCVVNAVVQGEGCFLGKARKFGSQHAVGEMKFVFRKTKTEERKEERERERNTWTLSYFQDVEPLLPYRSMTSFYWTWSYKNTTYLRT